MPFSLGENGTSTLSSLDTLRETAVAQGPILYPAPNPYAVYSLPPRDQLLLDHRAGDPISGIPAGVGLHVVGVLMHHHRRPTIGKNRVGSRRIHGDSSQ